MAYTSISDLVPEGTATLNAGVNYLFPQRAELITSSLAQRAPEVDALAGGGSNIASIPYLNPLDASVFNISNENVDDQGETGKITASQYSARRFELNFGWSVSDLTKMRLKYDVTGGIRAGIADYWNEVSMKLAVSSIKGALAADASLSYESGTGATEPFDMADIYNGLADTEEFADSYDVMLVSAARYGTMRAANAVAFDSETRFSTYQGFKLIVTSRFGANTVVLARSGALAFGFVDAPSHIPTEIERLANAGNGGGAEILHSRRNIVAHPQGFKYVGTSDEATPAALTTALETAANWQLAVDAKYVPFRAYTHG